MAGCAVVLGALLCCVVPSAAAAQSGTNQQLTLTGSLTFTWTGDQVRGCAAEGLCGITGELSLSIPSGSSESFSGPGLVYVQPNLSGAVRVRRVSGGSVTECVEPGDLFVPSLTISFSRKLRSALLQSMWSSGRCAGPLTGEVPSFRLPARESGGRHPSFDLSGTRSFGAGPFTVTASSTLRLSSAVPSAPHSSSTSSSSSFSGSFFPSTHRVRVEYLDLRYRLVASPSDLDVAFNGISDPTCQLLDSCGAAGQLTLSLGAAPTDFTLSASRVVHRPVSRSRAVSDFVHDRLGPGGGPPVSLPGNLTETLDWGNNVSCGDSRRVSSLALLLGSFPYASSQRRLVSVSLQDLQGPGFDPFRTHCPGPSDADIFGATQVESPSPLAEAYLGRRQLLARQTSIVLSPAGSFSGLGYTGTRGGSIKLELTLVAVSAGTRVETR